MTGNIIDGDAGGPVVQAGTVHGGVHLHGASADAPVPHQLPAQPPHFVGREPELAQIDELVGRARAGPALVVVSGVGGIGKSALALRWAHEARDRYPDGDLYVDLGAFDPGGPANPGAVLGQALRSLGVPGERLPAGTADLSALFRTVTTGKRLLIVLDNAVSAAQVRPLLPASASCVVLLTARWRLGGLLSDGAGFLTVEPLPAAAATELLVRAIGPDRAASDAAATAALVRLCAGLPIALTVACARLATRPGWPVKRVADELAQEHRRLRGLHGVFDMSYAALSDPVARCYRAVGVHPGAEFGLPVVAATLGVDEMEAGDLLDILVEANLVAEVAGERYRLHDLVRLHARQRAEADPEAPVIERRTLEWYLAGVMAADVLLTPHRRRDPADPFTHLDAGAVRHTGHQAALEWLEAERANLVAGVQYAARDEPLLAWRLADAMWALFRYRRLHHDRMVVDRIAVECARRLDDPDREARMLRRWAHAHVDAGRVDEARALFERSERLCHDIGDRYGAVAALEGVGLVALVQHRYADAAAHFGRQVRLCRDIGEHRRAGMALQYLGIVHNELGEYRPALGRLREAAGVFAGLPTADPFNAALIGIEAGRAQVGLGESAAARTELTNALNEMRRLGSPRGVASALWRLGELALSDPSRLAEARAHLAEAQRLYEHLGDAEAEPVRRLLATIPPAEADPDRVP
ncbi:tetratricopeptide repeat protein [Micromonospora sp. CPCC 206061]|uniref:tetratricopeptide repeat protein n=1 Tax=Micromonospora sp. CPCC 206061 TaxID=3122410 RepID=UPI002FF2BE5B